MTFWTDERVRRLKAAWGIRTPREIADDLGCSRSAVIGKAWREHISRPRARRPLSRMTREQRLRRIRQIIEGVDNRCAAADGPVTPTLSEMEQSELSAIYALACGRPETWRP